jgi:hypothetical protein
MYWLNVLGEIFTNASGHPAWQRFKQCLGTYVAAYDNQLSRTFLLSKLQSQK